jgi:hypothetical protein
VIWAGGNTAGGDQVTRFEEAVYREFLEAPAPLASADVAALECQFSGVEDGEIRQFALESLTRSGAQLTDLGSMDADKALSFAQAVIAIEE